MKNIVEKNVENEKKFIVFEDKEVFVSALECRGKVFLERKFEYLGKALSDHVIRVQINDCSNKTRQ